MKNLVLIQARCGSSRLPNKVLKDLAGKPSLQWLIERLQKSTMTDEIMVITSIEKNNLPIVQLCATLRIRVYVGSENDVLDRYYQAAKLLQPQRVIRITADCPLMDWRFLDMALMQMKEEADYMADMDETLPDGLDIEIIKFNALKAAWENAKYLSEREHVTLYIRNHSEIFKLQNFQCPIKGIGDKRLTMDEEEDYQLIKTIYDYFISEGNPYFVTEDIIKLLQDNPDLEKINAKFLRNEGLAKSIREDGLMKGN